MTAYSLIVPVYNASPYLRRCLDSILAQRLSPHEVILIDDGSTDDSLSICREYEARCDVIRVIHQPNGGQSAARNIGIHLAVCPWVGFVDADDWVEADMFADMIALAEAYPAADIVSTGLYINRGENQETHFDCPDKERVFFWKTKEALAQLISFRYTDMCVCNKLFKRSLFDGLSFSVGLICEDTRLSYQLIDRAQGVVHTTRPYYHYCQNPGSTTHPDQAEKNRLYRQAWRDSAQDEAGYIASKYPDLQPVTDSFLAFTEIGIYNDRLAKHVSAPEENAAARRLVRRTLPQILRQPYLPLIKKAQAIVFAAAPSLYDRVLAAKNSR